MPFDVPISYSISRETLYTKILRLPILYALQKCIIEMTLQRAKSTEVKNEIPLD